MIMKPSSSADFQEDPKVQSPDPIQIHLEPRVIQCLPHLQGQPPLAPLLRSNLSLPITRCSHVFPRSSCGFAPIMLRSSRVSAYYAGRWWWFGTPGGSRGSWWCVATRQVRRRRSWKRGRPGSSPVPEVPSRVTRWALCGLVQVMEVP